MQVSRDYFDYAYATRHGNPKADPTIINVHEDREVYDGWVTRIEGEEVVLENTSDIYNRFLFDGTWKMFARGGIENRVRSDIELVAETILEEEIMRELNK